jgi:hypothetical protein
MLGIVMQRSLVIFCLSGAVLAARICFSQECEPTAPTRTVLEQLEIPDDAHLPAEQRRDLELRLFRKAMSASPADIALHEAYQNVRLGGMEVNRPGLIVEYEQLSAKHPNDPRFLYLA